MRSEERLGVNAHERGRPGRFVIGMSVALAGFMLIWVPWKGLTIISAVISFGGTILMSLEVWRLASRRWSILMDCASEDATPRSVEGEEPLTAAVKEG